MDKCDTHSGEIAQIRTEFTQFKKDVKEIKSNSERLNKDFEKLMFHLVGDSETGTTGIIQDFRGIKLRLSRVEKFYVVVSGIIGFVIAYVTKKFM